MYQYLINNLFRINSDSDIYPKLSWLMFARVIFTAFLLVSTVLVQVREKDTPAAGYILVLYLLIGAIFVLSLLYAALVSRIKRQTLFAYIQIGMDSFIVTLIIFITGGFFSFFGFLYLVVVIYANMILYFRGGLVLALISSLQYGLLIFLQYYGAIPSLDANEGTMLSNLSGLQIVYKMLITAAACFAVAVLSGMLTEQNRRTQKELRAMESHVKRVEKMAYMGEMAAGLAHEIRNPLASLVGSIQLLKEDLPYDTDHHRLMEIVLRETDRLSSLVNEFLIFARPPAGKPEKFNLKSAIEEIGNLFEKDANYAKKRFVLEKKLVSDLWVVMDPTHLRQVLWNLLLNAAEAIDKDGRILIDSALTKNDEIQIRVADNGCGIPPDTVQSIFNPFFTTKQEGTGLGLSIVHRILEAYDSRLDVDSEVDKGTVFTFLLKRATA